MVREFEKHLKKTTKSPFFVKFSLPSPKKYKIIQERTLLANTDVLLEHAFFIFSLMRPKKG
jgi:hypothetical protein